MMYRQASKLMDSEKTFQGTYPCKLTYRATLYTGNYSKRKWPKLEGRGSTLCELIKPDMEYQLSN